MIMPGQNQGSAEAGSYVFSLAVLQLALYPRAHARGFIARKYKKILFVINRII
jgi:hypothetical protein